MYGETPRRRNKDGTPVRYLHLAHNQWDQAAGRSVPTILYGLGREDRLDRAAIKRLVASLSGLLEPADALAATAGAGLHFVESRPLGGAYVLDGLWHRLGIDKVMANLLKGRRLDSLLDLEVDLLFFDTTSTYFELDEPDEPVARDERGQVLPKTENGDGDGEELAGIGSYGKSKDHRDDLPQIVIGMAVTRAGI